MAQTLINVNEIQFVNETGEDFVEDLGTAIGIDLGVADPVEGEGRGEGGGCGLGRSRWGGRGLRRGAGGGAKGGLTLLLKADLHPKPGRRTASLTAHGRGSGLTAAAEDRKGQGHKNGEEQKAQGTKHGSKDPLSFYEIGAKHSTRKKGKDGFARGSQGWLKQDRKPDRGEKRAHPCW